MTNVPTITSHDLKHIHAVLVDIANNAKVIADKAPNVAKLSDNIERLCHIAFKILEATQGQISH